jgi:hypothetical protein
MEKTSIGFVRETICVPLASSKCSLIYLCVLRACYVGIGQVVGLGAVVNDNRALCYSLVSTLALRAFYRVAQKWRRTTLRGGRVLKTQPVASPTDRRWIVRYLAPEISSVLDVQVTVIE